MTDLKPGIGGADLLRAVGLMADGPVVLGRPLPARGPGVFVIELAAPRPTAPIELTRVGKWLERIETLRLDGARPTSRALAARLAAFWIPSSRIVYVGASETSIANRVSAIERTPLGERRPHSGGHWLRTLRDLDGVHVWWAPTTAVEEYEDALLTAFAETVPEAERAPLPDRDLVLPFANLRSATGVRKRTGIIGSIVAAEPARSAPPPRIVDVPPGDADGATGRSPTRAADGTVRRAPRPATAGTAAAGSRAPRARAAPGGRPEPTPTQLSAAGAARLQAELTELTTVRRPEVIGRIRSAKELGDLKENADYTAAREEQSFLEGRIASIEGILRGAVVAEPDRTAATNGGGSEPAGAVFGSRVSLEDPEAPGDTVTYELVGSAEADAAAGRISTASPVGRALLGRRAGEIVEVTTPRGIVRYRITAIA